MSIGSLIVQLQADIAQYTSSMDKAAALAEQRMRQIDKSLGIVKSSLTSLGAGFAAGLSLDVIRNKIEGVIESAAGLQQLAERTGATVESLSGLASVAKLSNTDTESLATGLQKLSKAMVDARDGGKKTAEAFRAIGISVDDIKGLKPDEVFTLISKQMAHYADGAEKTAIAQELLGKSGANLLPVMKDVADAGDLQVKTTAAQAAMADDYEKNLVRLHAAQNAIYKTVAMQVLPVMNAFTKAMVEAATRTDGMKGAVDGLAQDNTIRSWAEGAATTIGFVVDAFDGVARTVEIVGKGLAALAAARVAVMQGEFSQAKNILQEYGNDADAIMNKALFSDRLKAQMANSKVPAAGDSTTRPTPNFRPNTATSKDDPSKAILDGIFKAQDAAVAAANKAMQESEALLAESYHQQYLTASQFYAGKKQLIEEDLATELAAYNKEMDAAQAYINHADTEQKRQEGRNKLSQAATKFINAQSDAQAKLAKAAMDYNAPLRQFEISTKEVVYQYGLQNEAMQFQIDLMGKSTLEVQKLIATRQIDLALQQRIHDLKSKGYSDDELASRVAEATAAAEAQKAIVIAKTTSAYDAQRDAMFGAQEALRKYAEDAGNMGAHIENATTNALKGMEDALVQFVTTGKFNFKSLADSIIADIARIVIKEQVMKPLTQMLTGGGGGGMLASLFGGSKAVNMGTASGADMDVAFAGNFADGGYIGPGQWGWTGEEGPERIFGGSTGVTVHPNGGGSGGQPIVVHQNFTVGDVASVTQLKQETRKSELRLMAAANRAKTYGTQD